MDFDSPFNLDEINLKIKIFSGVPVDPKYALKRPAYGGRKPDDSSDSDDDSADSSSDGEPIEVEEVGVDHATYEDVAPQPPPGPQPAAAAPTPAAAAPTPDAAAPTPQLPQLPQPDQTPTGRIAKNKGRGKGRSRRSEGSTSEPMKVKFCLLSHYKIQNFQVAN